MAAITDKVTDVRNADRPNSASVASIRAAAGTTLVCNDLTGWPTASKVHFVTYQVDANSDPLPATQIDCSGIVSGSSIGSLEVIDGTDAGNTVGDVVEMLPTAAWGQDLADALTEEHDRTGKHTDITPDSVSTDTITEKTAASGVTIDSLNIKDGKVATAGGVDYISVANGIVVQVVNVLSSTADTGTTQIPEDDTIPQKTEGDQYMTLAITPKSTTNILVIDASLHLAHGASPRHIIAALFQDTTANALAVGREYSTVNDEPQVVRIRHTMAAGTTSATTFKVRAGANSTGSMTFNGQNGVRAFGGATLSSIVITEYKSA